MENHPLYTSSGSVSLSSPNKSKSERTPLIPRDNRALAGNTSDVDSARWGGSSDGVPSYSSEDRSSEDRSSEDRSSGDEASWSSSQTQQTDSSPERGRRRKCEHPRRSATREDAAFRGVTLQLRTMLCSDESYLAISAVYHCRRVGGGRRLRRTTCPQRHGDLPRTHPLVARDPLPSARHAHTTGASKQCISCGTKKTPLWRDTDDGTPLCNACGIRYKKYRIRCGHCWHIPKKDTKLTSLCHHCGHNLRYRSW